MWCGVRDFGFEIWDLGFGSGVWGVGCGVWGLGFGVWGLGFGVHGVGFRVWGSGCGAMDPMATLMSAALSDTHHLVEFGSMSFHISWTKVS